MRYEIVQLVPRQAGWQQEEEEAAAAAEASGSGNWRGETSNSVREVSWRQPSPFIRANLLIPRDNHNCTTAGDNLFVNQTHSLRQPVSVIRGSWRQPAPGMRVTVPTPGDIHSSTTIGDNLFVQQTYSRRQSAPVIIVTVPATSSWRQPSPVIRGALPTPRDNENCTPTAGDNLFVHQTHSRRRSAGVIRGPVPARHSGRQPSPMIGGTLPTPRDGHNCTTAGDNIFVQRPTHSRRQSTPVVRGTAPVTHSWRQPTPVTGDTLQTPRDNHNCTTGGYNLFASREKIMKWERVQLQPKQAHLQQERVAAAAEVHGPGKRWGHTCNAINEGRLLYVIGGYGRENCPTNEVHVFDTATHSWSQPEIKGMPPTPRDSHSCTTVGDNLFVFGGTDGMNPLGDLHILDTSLHTWISPSLRGEGPEARDGHGAALVGKRLFIFGGCGKYASSDNEVYFNDLYILNTETFVWKCATTSGNPPSLRDSHTCSSWKNKLIVMGGEDAHNYYLSDVHILDTDTLIWRELKTTGQFMTPRAGHCTIAFGKNLFVFGGFTDSQNLYGDLYMLDVDTALWTKVLTAGDGPSARFSVAGDCLDPVKGGVLVFIGGCNKGLEALDDMFYLNTGLERKLEKLSLRKQLKLKCQEQNLASVHDRALGPVGTSADMSQPTPVPYDQSSAGRQDIPSNQSELDSGNKTFVGKVTDKLADGYAIETVMDGKLLRGIVFPNQPGFNIDTPSSSRKRTAGEAGGLISNGDYSSNSKTSRGIRQETIDLTDNVHGKAPISHEQTEAAAGSISNNQAYAAASHFHKVTGNPEQSVVPLNLGKNQTNDAPNSNSEVLGDIRTHRTTDAPNFNSEATKESLSASANSAFLNQGDGKLTPDGQNDAASI